MPIKSVPRTPPLPHSADLQELQRALIDRDNLARKLFDDLPYLSLSKTANQTVVSGAYTPITWDRVRKALPTSYQTDPAAALRVEALGKIRARQACALLITGTVAWAVATTGYRTHWVSKEGGLTGGTLWSGQSEVSATGAAGSSTSAIVDTLFLEANEFFQVWAFHTQGSDLDLLGNQLQECSLKIKALW